ncbi:MAG: DUF6174 domain-containing protein [Marinagarivorans sp.]
MNAKLLPLVFVLSQLFGCVAPSDEPPKTTQPTPQAQQKLLVANMDLWKRSNLEHYQFKWIVYCDCLAQESVIITVDYGKVSGAFYTPSGRAYDKSLAWLPTVETIFGSVQAVIDEDPISMNVAYNKDFGYPEVISYDLSEGTDDEGSIQIHDFKLN